MDLEGQNCKRAASAAIRIALTGGLRQKEIVKKLTAAIFMFVATLAPAAVINVEFKFTPFVGDPVKDSEVTMVPGNAQVFINNIPLPSQPVSGDKVPVLFDAKEIAPAIWVPVSSLGASVRKGKNRVRIEFLPDDATKSYRAQLRWASVTDQPKEELGPGGGTATNQANEGVDDRKDLKGKVVFEREFTADFVPDLPWHHYPAVTSLTEEDKQKIAGLLKTRAGWFQPDFTSLYKAIEQNESLKVEDVRQSQCLEMAYKAGVRITAPAAGELDFITTGGPEVVVRRKAGPLFGLDEKALAPVKDETTQTCAGMALSVIYPGRLVTVRKPDGTWETVE